MTLRESDRSEFQLLESAPGLFHLHWRNRLVASLTVSDVQALATRISRVLSTAPGGEPMHLPCNREVILRLSPQEAGVLFNLLCLGGSSALTEHHVRTRTA